MDEPVREEPINEERKIYFDRDRYSALSRAVWRDFGPLIMGALVLLVVFVGGWYLWSKSQDTAEEPSSIVIEETGQDGLEVSLPTSEITIPGFASPRPSASPAPTASATPSPKPSVSPTPTAVAKGGPVSTGQGGPKVATGTATKGGPVSTGVGQGGQLPKTGPETALILLFTSLTGAGFALHKLSKRI
ncbi:MAG: cell wall anchor domain-containing protein [Microgenomates group bacterium Gr01-1014_5]|nr:MAG: cell wall anchor domain-containing protein [Microgenomates group bacterium Gr01-1014_5]